MDFINCSIISGKPLLYWGNPLEAFIWKYQYLKNFDVIFSRDKKTVAPRATLEETRC
jgi:hypothetical protein